ncbi:hypothetical protein G647_09946 [Cladophialophora carrionii CBS 160.54]|uniref:Malic acid transport protein n=1 Tax=Cladophialophora carrionii CBS 160.54 TaxID=1279043 RepID=V9DLP1_9EURO|nr:uncharacterized protein G647_09946 [Cladophialophora carrionii CBS 160.54]ETI27263.1 hypothetical protein G647_09946 [Cladophialophora carrionii CBS 160.54]
MPRKTLDSISMNYQGHRVTWRERISHFTWSWFECTMSTGAMATLLSQQPYGFHGLKTIGKIVFILDLVLFATFTALITLRFCLKRGALSRSLHHGNESFFFGTFWVSLALIIYSIQAYGVPSCGKWLVTTLEVLFWLYAACVMLVSIFQYHVIFDLEQLPVHEMMPAWILPVYPFLVLGPLAGTLLYSQPRPSAALPILIGGIAFQGLGWCFAFMQYTLYITRLTSGLLPDEPKRPGMFVAVGPAAYTSQALINLGSQAQVILPSGFLGITTIPVGDIWKAVGVAGGIFLWLVGFWFFAISLVGFVHGYKHAHFTLNWWALIFPNAGLTIALIHICNVLSSNAIKAVCSAMTIILCAVWLWVAALNIKAVWGGQILWPHKDEDMEDIEGHEQ